MGTKTKTPQLPRVTIKDNPELQRFTDAVTQTVEVREGRRGDKLDKALTYRDLVEVGLAKIRSGLRTPVEGTIPPGAEQDPLPTMATPPAPERVQATSGLGMVFLDWTPGHDVFSNYSFAKVYRATTDDFGAAAYLGAAQGGVYVDEDVTAGETYYYWVTFVSTESVEGPVNATAGTSASPVQDPAYLIDVLSDDETGDTPFLHLDAPTTINGVSIPAGTYMRSAWIHDATITNAMIGDLVVNNAKIADTTIQFGKMVKGDIFDLTVGDKIRSGNFATGTTGWRILRSGAAEFNDATVRGHLEMNSGEVRTTIGSSTFNSSKGWRLYQSGAAHFRGIVISRPNRKAYGTWTNPDDGSSSQSTAHWSYDHLNNTWNDFVFRVVVDTGFNDYEAVAALDRGAWVGHGKVTSTHYWADYDPGSTKLYDVACRVRPFASVDHYKTGASNTVPGGRILVELEVPLPRNRYEHIDHIRIDIIKWALMLVT